MNILNKLWTIYLKQIQYLSFSSKTYNIFNPLSKKVLLKRKGYYLENPTDTQVYDIYTDLLKKIRMAEWDVLDLNDLYNVLPSKWEQRDVNLIDKIIISSTNSSSWDAQKQFSNDTNQDNNISKHPLPGIGCHIFVNSNGIIEKTSDYNNIITHTPSVNTRSINVLVQYAITDNIFPPTRSTMAALEKILTILCLQFKLNPYKAIKAQNSIITRLLYKLPFFKGRYKFWDISPGPLMSVKALAEQVAIKIQSRLHYSGDYTGQVNGKFNKETKKALNSFHSKAIELLYKKDDNQWNLVPSRTF